MSREVTRCRLHDYPFWGSRCEIANSAFVNPHRVDEEPFKLMLVRCPTIYSSRVLEWLRYDFQHIKLFHLSTLNHFRTILISSFCRSILAVLFLDVHSTLTNSTEVSCKYNYITQQTDHFGKHNGNFQNDTPSSPIISNPRGRGDGCVGLSCEFAVSKNSGCADHGVELYYTE
jgi:hypothetical protein